MSQIIEIGIEVKSDEDIVLLEETITKLGFAFYVEPPNLFVSLEDLECQCEGK